VISQVGVVVPARDEEDLLPRCLDALHDAADRLAMERDLAVTIVVVLDSCTDNSAAIVARYEDVTALAIEPGSVGVARATGCAEVLHRHAPASASTLWLASTDADSRVPAHWLARQIELAEQGAELILGTVTVDDWTDHSPHVAQRWAAGYVASDGHPHVHGANVGCRADAYLEVGGFPGLSSHEDVALVSALAGRAIVRVGDIPVSTSARLRSRATGGFATFLTQLS
jgi:glycosyltransferase involved in cell wall biosynthesis